MSDRSIEVLEIFAEEGAHDRVLTSHGTGVWRQWRTPDVQRAARSVEVAERARQNLLDRHDTDQAVRAAGARLKRESRDRRRVAGTCIECGESRDPESSNYCTAHREAHRARAEKRRLKMREKFPENGPLGHKTRESVTWHFVITARAYPQSETDLSTKEVDGYATFGFYPDGRVGEVFLRIGKEGHEQAIYNQWAKAFSLALQYGAPLEVICKPFLNEHFEPSGPSNLTVDAGDGSQRPYKCASPVDLVCRYLMKKYGAGVRA